jgi:glycosyltransferase involved in cell wall biosynthesis
MERDSLGKRLNDQQSPVTSRRISVTAAEGKKRKVLIVSYNFPPSNNSGSVRVGKMAKYLPQFGWEPIVLTAHKPKGVPQTLPVEIDQANVVRTSCFELGSTVFRILAGLPIFRMMLPYPMGWYRAAIKAGCKLLSEHRVDVIFSSYFPSAPHFVASRLQRRAGIPWIAEFRDPWSFTPYSRKIWFSESVEERIERTVMKNGCLLIAVSEPEAQRLEEIHHKKVAVIPNGFDEEDYREEIPLASKFTISYTGTANPGNRDPGPFFEVVKQLQQEGKVSPDDFEVRFFGVNVNNFIPSLIDKYHLQELVKFYGFVPFRESIRKQKESTALLLLEWDDPSAGATYTGKIFEYLGARRPILAIAYKGGNIDRLLQESGTGILVSETRAVKDTLCHWLEEWRQLGKIVSHWKPNEAAIERYTRREGARKLAQLLEEVST